MVDGSVLAFACLPHGSDPAIQLDADAPLIIWQAILNAAKASGYQPLNGTLEETTVTKASFFSWDGKTLGFSLTADNATPPPGAP